MAEPQRRVAILGGSFDPITNAHLMIAAEILHSRQADEVWIVPCGMRPDKPTLQTPTIHRYLMAHMAVNTKFGSRFPVYVCDFELDSESSQGTFVLLRRLQDLYPAHDFSFVIGTDLIADLRSWTSPGIPEAGQILWDTQNFLVLERPGYPMPTDGSLPNNFILIRPLSGGTVARQELSSTAIRTRLPLLKVDGLTPPIVLAHILRNRLYQICMPNK